MADSSKLEQYVTDPIAPKYRYMYKPFAEVDGWSTDTDVSAGAGSAIHGTTATGLFTGYRVQAAADSHSGLIALPNDLDVEKDIGISIVWSCDQATADVYAWTVSHSEYNLETDSLDVAPATALTAIDDTDTATASIGKQTPWATIDGGTYNGTIADGYLHGLKFVATTNGGTEASDLLIWHGFVIRYFPRFV